MLCTLSAHKRVEALLAGWTDPHGEEKYNSSEIEKRGLKESEIVYPVQERVFCPEMQANEI